MAPVNRDNKKIEGFNVVSIPSEYSIKNSDGSFKKDFKMDLDGYIELKQFSSKEEVECYNDQKLKQILTWNLTYSTPTKSNSTEQQIKTKTLSFIFNWIYSFRLNKYSFFVSFYLLKRKFTPLENLIV